MGLNHLDFLIIGLYCGITMSAALSKKQRTLRDYFLAAGYSVVAISLSIVAAETSTLTIISIPGLATIPISLFCKW